MRKKRSAVIPYSLLLIPFGLSGAARSPRPTKRSAGRLFAFVFAFVSASAFASVPLRWEVETSRVQPAVFEAVRGETLSLEAAFKSYGRPVQMPLDGCCIIYQTNGMGSAWWQSPAAVSSNRVSAAFTPDMDPGAASVVGFLGATGQNYRAAFTLRFRHGPGAVPNAIAPPVRVLDLAHTTVVNPPWPTMQDFAATTTVMRVELKGYVDEQIEGATTMVTPQGVTNAAGRVTSNVVTKAYVESLGISAGLKTNDVNAILASSNLCTVAAADAKYLPKAGSDEADISIKSITFSNDGGTLTSGMGQLWCQKSFQVGGGNSPENLYVDGWDCIRDYWNYQSLPQWISSQAITNGGAVAAAEAKFFEKYSTARDDLFSRSFVRWDGTKVEIGNELDNGMLKISGEGQVEGFGGSESSLFCWIKDTAAAGTNLNAYIADRIAAATAGKADAAAVGATSNWVDGLIVHTNARFSNEVLKVGLGLGTNEVEQINALLSEAGETPIGAATTVGALLLALAAAVAGLKKNLRYANGGASSATMTDRASNTYALNAEGETVTLVFPAAVEGRMRDFLLNLTYTAGTLALPDGVTKVGDELTFTAGKEYLIAFTEISTNRFYVRSIEIA